MLCMKIGWEGEFTFLHLCTPAFACVFYALKKLENESY